MKLLFLSFLLIATLFADKVVKKRDAYYNYERYLSFLDNTIRSKSFLLDYSFGGQLSYDIAMIHEAEQDYFASDFRRIRLNSEGTLNRRIFYEVEYSYLDNNHYKDIYLAYKSRSTLLDLKYRVKLGNIKVPFSLERYSSSKYLTFMERSLVDAFSISRKLGIESLISKKEGKHRFNIFTSLFTSSIDDRVEKDIFSDGASLRLVYYYKFQKRHFFEVGTSYLYQKFDKAKVRIRQESESALIRDKYLSVKLADIDSSSLNNIELLYSRDNLMLQSEYRYASFKNFETSYQFSGYYLEGSYFLIGNAKRYKAATSTLTKVKPKKGGALELAFRYSYIDLNEKNEHGGSQRDYTYGLNYYVSKELKVVLNHVVAEPKFTDKYSGRLHIVQMRTIFAF